MPHLIIRHYDVFIAIVAKMCLHIVDVDSLTSSLCAEMYIVCTICRF